MVSRWCFEQFLCFDAFFQQKIDFSADDCPTGQTGCGIFWG
jgi:hypothetical protein